MEAVNEELAQANPRSRCWSVEDRHLPDNIDELVERYRAAYLAWHPAQFEKDATHRAIFDALRHLNDRQDEDGIYGRFAGHNAACDLMLSVEMNAMSERADDTVKASRE
jgi:hypothetical protein